MRMGPLDRKAILAILMYSLVLGIAGCSLPRNPVPITDISSARLIGVQGVRDQGDQYSALFQKDFVESVRQERQSDFPRNSDGSVSYSSLALSGGGSNGAFGAGFLCGWSETGTRPKFKLVTGVSTGSLIAPFAFLGSKYDEKLKQSYTTITAKNIYVPRNLLSLLWNESLEDNTPLQDFIDSLMNEDLLKAIAEEHSHGRRLYVGTTDMDAGKFIVWNMGAIASSGHPDALELFQKVLLASASIPGAFPPVYFDVEVEGKEYDEMHCDGGTIANVFFYGFLLDLPAARKEIFGDESPSNDEKLYVIRDGKLKASAQQLERKLSKIIGRSISIATKAGATGDLYRIYTITQRDGIDFNYIKIPDDYEPISTKHFDKAEMNRLFEFGFKMAKSGDKWHKVPPGQEEFKPEQ